MQATTTRPDTLICGFYINYFDLIQLELNALALELKDSKCKGLIRFNEICSLLPPEQSYALLKMNNSERVAYMKHHHEEETIEFKEKAVNLLGMDWKVSYSSPLNGCCMTFQNHLFKVHLRHTHANGSPNAFLEIGSLALWSCSWRDLIFQGQNVISQLGEIENEVLTRCDLAIHTQALTPDDLDYNLIRTRASSNRKDSLRAYENRVKELVYECSSIPDSNGKAIKSKQIEFAAFEGKITHNAGTGFRTTWYHGFEVQQIGVGRRGSRNPFMRAYVKSRELVFSPLKQKAIYEIWKQASFDFSLPVINVEFELTRNCLRNKVFSVESSSGITSFSFNSLQDVCNHYDDMLLYLMGRKGYIQWIIPSATESNRSRWAVDPRWSSMVGGLSDVKESSFEYHNSVKSLDASTLKAECTRHASLIGSLWQSFGWLRMNSEEFAQRLSFVLDDMRNNYTLSKVLSGNGDHFENKLRIRCALLGIVIDTTPPTESEDLFCFD